MATTGQVKPSRNVRTESGWTNPGNLIDRSDTNYATQGRYAAGKESELLLGGYDFSSLPASCVIKKMQITIPLRVNNTASDNVAHLDCQVVTDLPRSGSTYTAVSDVLTVAAAGSLTKTKITKVLTVPDSVVTWLNSNLATVRSGDSFGMRLYGVALFVYNVLLEIEYGTPRTITAAVSPAGAGTVAGGGTYVDGDTVTLTATPASGYRFLSWSDGNTNATRSITVSADATYTAQFERITYQVSSSLAHCSLSNTAATVNHGSAFTTNLTADAGYTIDRVAITMGGVDVTASVYSNGVINVASVTGAISITASATSARLPEFQSVAFSPNPARSGQGVIVQVTMA